MRLLLGLLLLAGAARSAPSLEEAKALALVGQHAAAAQAFVAVGRDESVDKTTRSVAYAEAAASFEQAGNPEAAKTARAWSNYLAAAPQPEATAVETPLPSPPRRGEGGAAEAGAKVGGGVRSGRDAIGTNLLKSAILPGWAHASAGESGKGYTLGVAAFGAWAFWAWSFNDANYKVHRYDVYAADEATKKAAGQGFDVYRPDAAYEEAQKAQMTNRFAVGVLATVYAIALFDSLRLSPAYNKSLFGVAPRADGFEVAYARRF